MQSGYKNSPGPDLFHGFWLKNFSTLHQNDLLYIDMTVIKEVKSRNKNLAMAWIDYTKAYDMVPHSWIIECLELFGVAENMKNLLVNSMEKWKVMLYSENFELGEVEI